MRRVNTSMYYAQSAVPKNGSRSEKSFVCPDPDDSKSIDSFEDRFESQEMDDRANVLGIAVGVSYVTRMVMLLFIRGLFKKLTNFRLETEVENVGVLDDIVFDEGGQKYWLLQLKYRSKWKQLRAKDILEVDECNDLRKAFNLLKYIKSYVKAKAQQKFSKTGEIKKAILFTNVAELDVNQDNEMWLYIDEQKRIEIQLSEICFGKNNLLFFQQRSVKYYKFNDPTLVSILYEQATKCKAQDKRLGDLTPENIKDALDNLIYAVGQPTDSELEEITKCEIQSYFRISRRRTESLVNDLQVQVIDWLRTKNRECNPRKFPPVLTFDVAQSFFQKRLKTVSFGVCPPAKKFFGRQRELKVIKDQLMYRSRLCVTGLPGCGKPEVVRKFIESYGSEEYFDRVIWMDAYNNGIIEIEFKRLVKKLNLRCDGVPADVLIEYFLCEFFYNLKTLFVFDDFKVHDGLAGELQRQILKCMMKITNEQQSCCPGIDFILIANKPIPGLQIACVKIGPLEKPQALNMLMSGFEDIQMDEGDKKSLELIADMMECYPLGLCLAMSFMRKEQTRLKYFQNSFKIREYLQELDSIQKRAEQKYAKCLEKFNSYEKSVFFMLILVLTRIQQDPDGAKAITMLKILAFIYPYEIDSNIFLPLFRCGASEKPLNDVSSGIKLLKRYCLIKLTDCNTLVIHPLTQKLLRYKFRADLDLFGQKQLLANVLKVILWDTCCLRSNFGEASLQNVVSSLNKNNFCTSELQRLNLCALYPFFVYYSDLMNVYGLLFDDYRQKLLLKVACKPDLKAVARLLSSKTTAKRMIESSLRQLVKNRCDDCLKYLIEEGFIDVYANSCLAESLLYLMKKYGNDRMEKYLKEKGVKVEKFNEDEVQKLSSKVIQRLIRSL